MAIPATTVFEVRPTGSDTQCAGGFNAARGGTDYSQQDTAQATGTVTSSGLNVTATTGIFTSLMVGNLISDGTAAGTREITGFSSSTVVTVDSAPSWTSATVYVGGAFATPGRAAGVAVVGNTIWTKGGTYTFTSASTNIAGGCLSIPASGSSSTLYLALRAYTTTRGDGAPTKAILDAGSLTSFTLITLANVTCFIEGFELKGNGNTSGRGISGGTSMVSGFGIVRKCKGTGFTNTAFNTAVVYDCEASGCSGAYAIIGSMVRGCNVHGNTAGGIQMTAGAFSVGETEIWGNSGGHAINANNNSGVISNVSIANNTGTFDGVGNYDGARGGAIRNTVIWGVGRYGVNANGSNVLLDGCAIGSATSGATNGSPLQIGTTTLTADPYTNAASGDLSLNTTSGGGAACRALGIPGAFPGGTTTGYPDIGAVQHQDAGGSNVYAPGVTQTMVFNSPRPVGY